MPAHTLMLFYGALAGGALVALWHNRAVRPLGWALVIAWALSNIIHLGLSFEWRPVLYPMIDLMITIVAGKIWFKTGYKIAVVATILSLLNCMTNVSYAILALNVHTADADHLKHSHTLATNIVFGVKCVSLLFWGAADAYGWFGRIGYLFGRDRGSAQHYSRREAGE